MGWNDRLPEDPFIPSSEYYEEQDRHEAWLEYMTAQSIEKDRLTSQNIDPAQLTRKPSQETPAREGIFARLWANFFGHQDNEEREDQQNHTDHRQSENTGVPF